MAVISNKLHLFAPKCQGKLNLYVRCTSASKLWLVVFDENMNMGHCKSQISVLSPMEHNP